MFNIKFPIKLIIFLLITILINVFSTVTLKYNAISLNDFRSYEIICGDIFEVVQATSNSEYSERLGANWRQCRESIVNPLSLHCLQFAPDLSE